MGYYERRWLIEEYHKAWKSGGAQVEQLRMQTRDNLERMVTILAFVAVRVLALRQGGVSEETQNESCESVLSPVEWKLLWVKQERKALPGSPPTLKWACQTLAKLGRWYDSKRTGRSGWIVAGSNFRTWLKATDWQSLLIRRSDQETLPSWGFSIDKATDIIAIQISALQTTYRTIRSA